MRDAEDRSTSTERLFAAIDQLDRGYAERLLVAVTGVARNVTPNVLTADELIAVRSRFQTTGEEGATTDRGTAARDALKLVALDDSRREDLASAIYGPKAEAFGVPEAAMFAAAIIAALQIHVRFTKDEAGQTTLLIEKKPTSLPVLKPLVARLLTWMGSGTQ
jgi:hypothetical protein